MVALRHADRKQKAAGSGFKCMTNVRLRERESKQ